MPLTTAQLQTLKTDLAANNNTVLINGVATAIKDVPHGSQNAQTIADWYNLATASTWIWKNNSPLSETGMAIKMSDVGNLTTANSTRLQVSFQIRPGGFNPSLADDRSLFGGLFSVAGASGTRAALLTIWQRLATNAEKLFSTGTGSQATGDLNSDGTVTVGSPATTTINAPITGGGINGDVILAWAA